MTAVPRRGFTLIELLIIVAIIGTMLAVATGNIVAGMGNAELSAGGRTVVQLARHARTLALIKQKPCVITYIDGGPGDSGESSIVLEVGGSSDAAAGRSNIRHIDFSGVGEDEDDGDLGDGDSKSELAELMDRVEEKFKGLRIKAEPIGSDGRSATERKGAISVFSNVDYLLQQSRSEREALRSSKEGEDDDDSKDYGSSNSLKDDPLSVIFETNGRVQAHKVTLYRDGADPDKDGISIKVDLFGKVEVEDE